MKGIGELIEVISQRAGLDNVREVGESLKSHRRTPGSPGPGEHTPSSRVDEAKDLLDVVGSDLLEFGQMLIGEMKSTTGEGAPDTGALFGRGQSAFSRAGQTMQSAGPDDRWEGAGSRAYADQNTRQQLRTEAMADADLEVHRILYREAGQITLRRKFLDDYSNFLANTSYVTFPLQFIPRYGEAAKMALEAVAVQNAMLLSGEQMYRLQSEVNENAAALQQALGRYLSVDDGAEKSGAVADYGPPPHPPGGGSPTAGTPLETPVSDGGPAGGGSAGGGTTVAAPAAPVALPEMPTLGASAPEVAIPTVSAPPATAGQSAPATGESSASGATSAAGSALGTLAGSLAGLVAGVVVAAAERAEQQAERDRDDGGPDGAQSPERSDDDEEPKKADAVAAAGDHASGPAPVDSGAQFDSDDPQAPVAAVKLDPDTSPGPPAGTSPQDTK